MRERANRAAFAIMENVREWCSVAPRVCSVRRRSGGVRFVVPGRRSPGRPGNTHNSTGGV